MSLHGKPDRPGAARGIDIITALFPDPAGGYRSFTERFAEAHLEHEFFAADDDGVLRPLSSFPVEDLGDGWTRQGPFIRADHGELDLGIVREETLAAADPPTLAEVFRPVQVTSESVE